MIKKICIILSALAAAGTSVFYADMFKKMSGDVADVAARRPNVENEIDAMVAGVEETESLDTDSSTRRTEENTSRGKWLTPFSKTLSGGREPIARVSTDWTDVRCEYHMKGRAARAAKTAAVAEVEDSARHFSEQGRRMR